MSTLAVFDLGFGVLAGGLYLLGITNVRRKSAPLFAILALVFSFCGLVPAFLSGPEISVNWLPAIIAFSILIGLSLCLLDQKDIKATMVVIYQGIRRTSVGA